MGRRCCGAYGGRTYALALITAHRTVLLYLLLSHSTFGKIICRAGMTADGVQTCCYARAAGYSLDVDREEAIVISLGASGRPSALTACQPPAHMSIIFSPLRGVQGTVQRQHGRDGRRRSNC
jgi:hypothetical protein